MPKKKYKFRLFSAVLATVCIILVGDAVAPRKNWIEENVIFSLEDDYKIA